MTEGDDSAAEFTIKVTSGDLSVSGQDRLDGEAFEISDVSWEQNILNFTSRMPSADHTVKHTFTLVSESKVKHEYTLTEMWVKV